MLEWMGRYRSLVAALVQHVNVISKSNGTNQFIYKDIYLTPNEWQVLEYVAEHREDDEHMMNMSAALAIPQSSFSKIIKKLCSVGLIERYKTAENRKNIILKPTDLAMEAYKYHTSELYSNMFKPFFDELEGFSNEDLDKLTHAIETFSKCAGFNDDKVEKKDSKLIKLD